MKHNMGFASLSSFIQILREAFNIFFRNGKLLPSVTLAYVSLNSLLYFSFLFATKHLLTDYTTKMTNFVQGGEGKALDPSSPDFLAKAQNFNHHIMNIMKHEARLFVAVYIVFIAVNAIASFIFSIAAISISAKKKLRETMSESWRRALVTVSYTVLLNLGFVVSLAFIVLPIELFSFNSMAGKISTLSKAVIFIAMILYFHLAVVWILGLVVSVMEEKSGFGAFTRASGLVKELRLQGFLVNVLFGGLSYAVYEAFRATLGVDKIIWLMAIAEMNIAPLTLLMAIGSAVKAFSVVSNVALYFEGRKICGDEVIELQGYTVEYEKVPDSAKFVSSDFP